MQLSEPYFAGRTQDFPDTEQLLISGGDARIALDPVGGMNKYGCQPYPDPTLLAFGSSTASVISQAGFAAANQLRNRLLADSGAASSEVIYAREMLRIRQTLLSDVSASGVELAFATSGTDAHVLAARYVASVFTHPVRVVMVEEDETGSGVAAALSATEPGGQKLCAINLVPLRLADGMPRRITDIDTEVTALVNAAVALGERVLLIMVDQSKTGMIAPSPACVVQLHQRHPNQLMVLVDACQFRLAPPTLRAYLQQGFMVALTGSKFLTGPSFSAALLFPKGLQAGAQNGGDCGEVNFGLLLRWEAALVELRRFRAVPDAEITRCLEAFAITIQHRLMSDPHFESLAVPPLDRQPLQMSQSWDYLPTIFPFLLYHPETAVGRVPLSRGETLQVYRQLHVSQPGSSDDSVGGLRCQFGQPVACGMRDGVKVSALRLCISARHISEAVSRQGISGVIEDALAALDKTAGLI
ncbi:MAG: hypothetical protein WC208_05840 [Gallionella sp.]